MSYFDTLDNDSKEVYKKGLIDGAFSVKGYFRCDEEKRDLALSTQNKKVKAVLKKILDSYKINCSVYDKSIRILVSGFKKFREKIYIFDDEKNKKLNELIDYYDNTIKPELKTFDLNSFQKEFLIEKRSIHTVDYLARILGVTEEFVENFYKEYDGEIR